jgi:hypothetical protein|tara:strand:+ start:159 stop:548 length:390 start_codon:yes stop_codon:yes gene_type:complete
MTKLLLMLLLLASPAAAVPVVPSFSTGLVSSRTESKSVIKEKIISESYRTGFEYMVGGQGVKPSSGVVSPPATTNALSFSSRSNWVQEVPGAAFQFSEAYSGPGLIEKVIVDRETVIESVVDSTSTFSQ